MRSDAWSIILIIMGIILGIVIYLVLFVPPQEVLKYFGKGNENLPASFKVPLMYYTSNGIYAIIYNNGPSTIYLEKMNVYTEYSLNGEEYNCNLSYSNNTIYTNNQENVIINCYNQNQIIENLLSNNGYYIFYFYYGNYIKTYNLTSKITT